jgi:hypothetical protein
LNRILDIFLLTKTIRMKSSKFYRTDFLFPSMSFVGGMGSVLNIMGNYYKFNTSSSTIEADSRAIESDWGVIGKDIENTVKKHPLNTFKGSLIG